jgi:hypothetical protein
VPGAGTYGPVLIAEGPTHPLAAGATRVAELGRHLAFHHPDVDAARAVRPVWGPAPCSTLCRGEGRAQWQHW